MKRGNGMMGKRTPPCFEDGPEDEDLMPTLCLLPDGHEGPHTWTPINEITVRFVPETEGQPHE